MRQISKAWIFISHSVKDLEKVRRIRNVLEERGANPLLFFLKCISDDDELDELLKREIRERNFFLLCDSPNSQNSKWVQEEVEFVKSHGGKRYREIDLSANWEVQLHDIESLLRDTNLFLSYAGADWDRIAPYATCLIEHDCAVFRDADIEAGSDWQTTISDAVKAAADNGYFVLFLSKASLQSEWVRHEFEVFSTTQKAGAVIFVALDPIINDLPPQIAQYQVLNFADGDFAVNSRLLLDALGLRQSVTKQPSRRQRSSFSRLLAKLLPGKKGEA